MAKDNVPSRRRALADRFFARGVAAGRGRKKLFDYPPRPPRKRNPTVVYPRMPVKPKATTLVLQVPPRANCRFETGRRLFTPPINDASHP